MIVLRGGSGQDASRASHAPADFISDLIGETTSDAFVCVDVENRIIHWNRAAEVMFGWSKSEALGRTLDLIMPKRHREGHRRGLERVRSGGPSHIIGKTVEVSATTRDGSEIQVELSLGMWRDAESGVPGGFVSIMRDVTERHALEDERRRNQERLAQQVEAIEAAHDGIAFTDAEGRFVYMNTSHARMFGFETAEEPIGLHWRILYTEEEAIRFEQEAFPILHRDGKWRGELVGRRRDGTILYQEVSLSQRSDGGLVCVTRDIGARLEADRDKARLREQLLAAQRQEAVGLLAAGVAHDFNNVIAAIAASTALIEAIGDADVVRHARRIQRATQTASALVAKMLSAGARQSKLAEFDIGAVVSEVAELIRTSIGARHRLVVRTPARPLIGIADQTELMQVVLNLAVNARDALKSCEAGKIVIDVSAGEPDPELRFVVGDAPAGPAAIIRVSDNGSGIAEPDLDSIFKPFFSRHKANGTGLGLSVVASIVNAVGGGVTIESRLGEGTTFTVYWPLDARLPALPPTLGGGFAHTPDSQPLRGQSILVVDDNPDVVELLSELLERAGAEPGPCADPNDALSALIEDPEAWNLMITDYDMPGMNGLVLADKARRLRPDLPIILCTAKPDLHRDGGLFDAVLGKPVDPAQLVSTALTAIQARGIDPCAS